MAFETAHVEASMHEKIKHDAKKNKLSYTAQLLEYMTKANAYDEQKRNENSRKEELKQRKAARQMKAK